MKDLRILVLSLTLAVVLTACSDPDGNFTGSEYMPDMGHSLALEANTYNYYYYNTWDEESTIELAKLVYPRSSVAGAVPRGYAASFIPGMAGIESMEAFEAMRGSMVDGDGIAVPTNGYVPYYYEDSDTGRLQAIAELIDNPFPITEDGLERGENLYNIFCGICHGEKGNGLGYIYDEEQNPNAKYPLAPANFVAGDLLTASNGRYYNAIMYGYNAMGAYKDKMGFEERWQ
ncbi:MAG: cytochrome c, partial [Bacteroidota bacterium]